MNTILAGNDGNNCSGTTGNWTSLGHNLSSDFSCAFVQTGDQQGVDALLGLLADNGGATLTHALLPGSPAIDTGSNAGFRNDGYKLSFFLGLCRVFPALVTRDDVLFVSVV